MTSDHAVGGAFDFPDGMRIFYSKAIPKETLYLMPEPIGEFSTGPIVWQRDPWPEPPRSFKEPYLSERQKALGFLADLLDDTYTALGWDPEEWREAKHREASRWDTMRYMAHERMALSVMRPGDLGWIVTP
jgi:hypothetical protein